MSSKLGRNVGRGGFIKLKFYSLICVFVVQPATLEPERVKGFKVLSAKCFETGDLCATFCVVGRENHKLCFLGASTALAQKSLR